MIITNTPEFTKGDVIVSKDKLIEKIKEVELKLSKYEPNSIMGVHYSSKLAGLKRELDNAK